MDGKTLDLPHRMTTVLERRDGRWLMVQMHLSVANGARAVGQSFPTNLEAVADAVGREGVDLQARVAPDGTVTLLFTDIEGSTPLAEQLGDLQWLALRREHNAIVREQIAQYGGFDVKTIGDAFMVAFRSARRALLSAIGIQGRSHEAARTARSTPCACASVCTRASRCARATTSTARARSSPRDGRVPRGRRERRPNTRRPARNHARGGEVGELHHGTLREEFVRRNSAEMHDEIKTDLPDPASHDLPLSRGMLAMRFVSDITMMRVARRDGGSE